MLWSVVWFHTKSKPHNDCHKSGFFTTVFWLCDCHCRPSPLHCNYPFHLSSTLPIPPSKQHTSIPDQCRCQHQHCWKSIQRCRWTPKSLLAFTKHSEVGYVDWGPSGSHSALAISQNVGEKNRLLSISALFCFCNRSPFLIPLRFNPAIPACSPVRWWQDNPLWSSRHYLGYWDFE